MNKSGSGFINALRFFSVLIIIVFGFVAIIGSSGSSSGDGDSDGGNTTETPEIFTASGTYTYNSGTGELTANFKSSDFTGCGPELGTSIFDVDSITAANMVWGEGTEDELTWSRDSGTAGNIVGTWNMGDNDGNSYELNLNSDGSMLLTAEIVECGDDGGSGDGDSGTGSQSLTINGESGNPVDMDGTWESGCNYDSNDDETHVSTLTVSGSTFTQIDDIWFGASDCSGSSDATITANGSVSLGDEVTASKDGSDVAATKADVNFSSYTGTINNASLVPNFNSDTMCGFDNWVVDTPKDLLGTSCGPGANKKDIFYIDDLADPDVWYGGDENGPMDTNGYPTQLELSSAKERT